MKSMTGYGRGVSAQDGYKITVELNSVNRRQSELMVYLPRELECLESRIRDEVNRQISRGRMTARISLHASEKAYAARLRLNFPLAKAYARELQELSRELHLSGPILLDHILRAPGVLQSEEDVQNAESFWPSVHKALREALTGLLTMREREGQHLARDLTQRMSAIRKHTTRIQKQAPKVVKFYQEQLLARVKRAGLEKVGWNDPRLLQEVTFFADRSDVSEELTRLASHFQQFDDCLKVKEPVGRTLDFLAQEMNREVNTIGSKANDALISRHVVSLKAELEKFREQVQNVE
jgi:uncharacterized protein (TIGR00255 family)